MFKALQDLQDHKVQLVLKALKGSLVYKVHQVLDLLAHKACKVAKAFRAHPGQVSLDRKVYKAFRVQLDLLAHKVFKECKALKVRKVYRVRQVS